jgi:hypothetical protein
LEFHEFEANSSSRMWLDFMRADAGRCVILVVQVVTTWAMTGIIWFVQLVQYPSFAQVDAASFPAFHERHSAAISIIVAPLMILEALSAFAFLWAPLHGSELVQDLAR